MKLMMLVCVYGIGVCLCREIDYEKERRKICKKAGIKDGNCTSREDCLVNEYLNLKQKKEDVEEMLSKERQRSDAARENVVRQELQKNSAERRVNVRDIVIGFRSEVEKIVDVLLIPQWMLHTQLSLKQRILIVATLRVNKYSPILHERLRRYGLTPFEFASAVDQFYGDSSNRFKHFHPTMNVPTSKEEWEEVFQILRTTHDFEKNTVKVFVEAFGEAPEVPQGVDPKRHFFVWLANVHHSVPEKAIEELFASIEEGAAPDVHLVTKHKGLRTGYVAVDFISKKNMTAREVRTQLMTCISKLRTFPADKKLQVNVYTETNDRAEDLIEESPKDF